MLARACERLGWQDLAWHLFQHVVQATGDEASRNLARQAMEMLPPLGNDLPARLLATRTIDPVWLARARAEAQPPETALGWLLRHDACSFDKMADVWLAGRPLRPVRPMRDRLGMHLIAERRISQVDLKRALSLQALDSRPLGAILIQDFGLPPSALETALKQQSRLVPTLGSPDAPQALLMRWGALEPRDWEAARRFGAQAFDHLVAEKKVLAANVRRAEAFRQAKLRILAHAPVRLGSLLVERGVIDRETLGKALAWQVDQPYRLGELLVRHRLASPEQVLDALREQAVRVDEQAERDLPPLEVPRPAPPPPEAPPPRRPWRAWLLGGVAVIAVAGALAFATRYSRGDFAWLSTFERLGPSPTPRAETAAEMLGGSQATGARRERVAVVDPLVLPESGITSQPLAERQHLAMLGASPSGGFVGERTGEGLTASAAPASPLESERGEPLGEPQVGAPSEEEPVGSSGVTDSVRYGRQAASGAKRTATSRRAELLALERLDYPAMQAQENLSRTPERFAEAPASTAERTGGQLQEPIGLGNSPQGSPPEGIQVRRDTALFRLRIGRALYERNDLASAREELLSAVSLDPTLSPPHYYLGRIAEGKGDRELAVQWYQSYLKRTAGGEFVTEVNGRLERLAPARRSSR